MSSKRAQATLRLKFSDQKQLATLLAALTPEVAVSQTHRAHVTLGAEDCFLVLSVDAQDTVALRATLNAYLHWINSTLDVIDVVANA
jgi:tRNA threonylcarbamoyladenosine modification (KEOPS) complex  Pcc1 subunit